MTGSDMAEVLFLNYYFPPTGGAPAQRALKFLRYLPAHGYKSAVITGPGQSHNQWTPQDRSLGGEISEGTPILRVPTPVPEEKQWAAGARRWLGLESAFSKWWISEARGLGDQVLASRKVRLICASMSPFESAEVAAGLSLKWGVPWVADLRDPWAIDEIHIVPTAIHRWASQRRMRQLLSTASLIVMNTPEATAVLRKAFPEFRDKRLVTITNGFEPEDFAHIPDQPRNPKFTIVHTGSFFTDSGLLLRRRRQLYEGLGGAIRGVDIATRSPLVLYEAIQRWCCEDPTVKDNLEIVFAGTDPLAELQGRVDEKLLRLTRVAGYVPRKESLRLVKSADLLFLPMHNVPVGMRATTIPSKLYEYMASGRPILAAVPEGDAKDYLVRAGTAMVCSPDDCDGMKASLQAACNGWKRNEPAPRLNEEFVATFHRQGLSARLAQEFDAVLGTLPMARHQSEQLLAPA